MYVLGHVMVQPFSKDIAEVHNKQLKLWLDLVQISKVKAFVELTISDSVRNGARNLLTVSDDEKSRGTAPFHYLNFSPY